MENIILILILLLVVGGATFYIYKEKKKGHTCVGCPYAKECSKKSCQINK